MSRRYEIDCVDCSFATTVVGDFGDVQDEVAAHREERATGPLDHFVNVRSMDRSTDAEP